MVLTGLLLFEILLLGPFLPDRWESAVDQALTAAYRASHDQSLVTHPNLEAEISQVLRENRRLRISLDFMAAVLLAANTLVIVKTWRALRFKGSGVE
jgi:hypothetical protein